MYLSVIRDVFDGYIVAYKYSTHIDSKLVADTLKPAYKNNKIDGTILHSDQGSTYTTLLYYNLTKKYGITPSMSRKATPLDNAPAESFFSAFKTKNFSYPTSFIVTKNYPYNINFKFLSHPCDLFIK